MGWSPIWKCANSSGIKAQSLHGEDWKLVSPIIGPDISNRMPRKTSLEPLSRSLRNHKWFLFLGEDWKLICLNIGHGMLKKVLNLPSTSFLLTFFLTEMAIFIPKGQLISKCPFVVFKSTRKYNKSFVRISVLAPKKKSNQKKEHFITLTYVSM